MKVHMGKNRQMRFLNSIVFGILLIFSVSDLRAEYLNNNLKNDVSFFRNIENKTDTIKKGKWTIIREFDKNIQILKETKIKYLVYNESARDFIRITKEYDEKGKLINRKREKIRLRLNL